MNEDKPGYINSYNNNATYNTINSSYYELQDDIDAARRAISILKDHIVGLEAKKRT